VVRESLTKVADKNERRTDPPGIGYISVKDLVGVCRLHAYLHPHLEQAIFQGTMDYWQVINQLPSLGQEQR
jgi:hypothetical protein